MKTKTNILCRLAEIKDELADETTTQVEVGDLLLEKAELEDELADLE